MFNNWLMGSSDYNNMTRSWRKKITISLLVSNFYFFCLWTEYLKKNVRVVLLILLGTSGKVTGKVECILFSLDDLMKMDMVVVLMGSLPELWL